MKQEGQCYICNETYSKSGIFKHLKKCTDDYFLQGVTNEYERKNLYLIHVIDRYNPSYFMYILVDMRATLSLLDDFLRGIWLECCGHLSEFRINGERYSVTLDDDLMGIGFNRNYDMEVSLEETLYKGLSFGYTYDFGSSTELVLTVKECYHNSPMKDTVHIIARNNSIKGDPYNSPRTGVCGYCGDDDFDVSKISLNGYDMEVEAETKPNDMSEWPDLDDEIDEDEMMEMLLNSFEEMANDYLEKDMKKASKYYINPKETSLESCLSIFTKQELYDLARDFNIKGLSTLNKKQLKNKLLIELPTLYQSRLNYFESDVLKKISLAEQKGRVKIDVNEYGLDLASMLVEFISKTMLFPINDDVDTHFILPDELVQSFKATYNQKLKSLAKANSQLIKIVRGLVYYYGVIEIDIVYNMLMNYGIVIDYESYWYVINNNLFLDDGLELMNSYVFVEGVNPYELMEEIENREKVYGVQPYKNLKLKDLLAVTGPDYYVRTREIVHLEKTIKKYFDLTHGLMGDFISDLVLFMDNMERASELTEFIAETFDCPDINAVNEILMAASKVYNAHRQWVLKGHSPNELSQLENVFPDIPMMAGGHQNEVLQQKQVKIGRNAPCPCGSGKKYKRCCGK